jgi:branched-chain amino acid transport system permease protein
MPRKMQLALMLVTVAALAAVPAFKPPAFYEAFLYLVFLWVALATSWAILSGFSGYFSFGHGAFYGAGVYTTAVLASRFSVPFEWTLPAAGGVAAVLGLGIGAVVFRLKRLRGEVFALLTLAVTFVVATIILNTKIDGGPGIFLVGVKLPSLYPSTSSMIYLFGLGIAFLSVLAAWVIQYSRLGRALFAIADDEDVAEVMGIPTYRLKLVALGVSCFLAGVAGGIHAVFVSYITVGETFSITVPLFVILMSILGGARHWLGPAIGAACITALSYAFVGGNLAVIGRGIIGLILVVAVLFLPTGVMGLIGRLMRKRRDDAAEPASPPALRGTVVRSPAPLLRCEDVHLAFRGVKALAGVNLEAREGEVLGLVGPNGSGKSTLVNAVSGFYRPNAGRVILDGQDLTRLDAYRIARLGIARTYQIPRPYARLTVRENVALAGMFGAALQSAAAAERDAMHWLAFVGLAERAGALPAELNLHQRKFLELARALAARPRLVLLDEVLSGLTPPEVAKALELIRKIRSNGATIVFIEHNMRAVLELSDRLVVLNYGEVIADGKPHEVVQQGDVVSAYLGAQHA